nr:hypothetical protein [Brucella intermedia]
MSHTEREYPFFRALLDLTAIHAKKVSAFASLAIMASIPVISGAELGAETIRDYEMAVGGTHMLLLSFLKFAVFIYTLIQAMDVIRTRNSYIQSHYQSALKKLVWALALCVALIWIQAPRHVAEAVDMFGFSELTVWRILYAETILTGFLLPIWLFVESAIRSSTDRR